MVVSLLDTVIPRVKLPVVTTPVGSLMVVRLKKDQTEHNQSPKTLTAI